MKTMDAVDRQTTTPDGALSAPAASRNVAPILEVLAVRLPGSGRVLEIASGTGEHAVAFAAALPGLSWTPSDPSTEARASIAAWSAASGLPNMTAPLALDVTDETAWPGGPFEAMVCINMIHISPWAATEALMQLAGSRLTAGGVLYLYGPFREAGQPLAPSNAAFDDNLKTRDPAWGLREVTAVRELAALEGLELVERVEMPANNLSLIFRKS